MANPAADPKAAPLAVDQKEYLLYVSTTLSFHCRLADRRSSLDAKLFPKNFFCSLCNELAFDSYKLLCCNKAICSSCKFLPIRLRTGHGADSSAGQAKIEFPATCPSCEHSPLEADSCTVNKALRGTMRAWLVKQKKKDERAAAQAATPAPEVTPAPTEVQPTIDDADKPTQSIEQPDQAEDFPAGEASVDRADGEELQRADSEASQPQEVSYTHASVQ